MLRAIIVAALASAAAAASSPASADGDSDGCGEGVPPWGHLYLRFGAGGIQFYTSAFSSSFPCQALPLVLPEPDDQGCGNFTNADAVNGSIVVAQRGVCSFTDKAKNAQRYGAHGLIVLNTQPGLLRMPGSADDHSLTIASAMVG